MVDVEAGLKYPLRGDGTLKLHAIGGGVPVLLNLLTVTVGIIGFFVHVVWFLLLPLVPALVAVGVLWTGYYVRVARDTFEGGTEPPAFEDWGGLARDGVWGSLVVLVYMVPGVVLTVGGYLLMFVFVFGASYGVDLGADSAAATAGVVGALVMVIVSLVVLVYSLVAVYLLPISLVAYADEASLGAAFSLDTLTTVGRSSDYVKPWAAAVGVYMLVYMTTSFLTAILVGYLLVPFLPLVYFYLGTAAFYMFARSYADITGMTTPAAGTVDETVGAGSTGGVGTRPPEDV